MAEVAPPVSLTNGHLVTNGAKKIKNKAALRRAKAKEKKAVATQNTEVSITLQCVPSPTQLTIQEDKPQVAPLRGEGGEDTNVEYVPELLDVAVAGIEAFSDVFARFQTTSQESSVRGFDSLSPIIL